MTKSCQTSQPTRHSSKTAGAGFAGGSGAKAVDSSNNGIDAIQLGTGTNSAAKTLQAYGYQLMDANGKIPMERLPNAPQAVEEIEVTTNDIFMADELDAFTCGMEEVRAALINQHFTTDDTGEGTAYGIPRFITVESRTNTYDGDQDGHPFLTQTLYYGPGLVYTRKGEPDNAGAHYTWDSWKLIENGGGIPDAPSNGSVYGRKNGSWESITACLDTKADKTTVEAALETKADKSYVDSGARRQG